MTGAAELHAHSHYSLLDGVDGPARLVEQALRVGLSTLAITDHDSLAAVPGFAKAARGTPLATVFGAELNLGLPAARTGMPDPPGTHLLVLARTPAGYRRLSAAISTAMLRGGSKGHPEYDLAELADAARGEWEILTGCRKSSVPAALAAGGPAAAAEQLRTLIDLFPGHVHIELTRHDQPGDDRRCDQLAELAAAHAVPTVATGNVHYAVPGGFPTYAALAAIRARATLADIDSWLPAGPVAFLRPPGDTSRRYMSWPGAVERAAELGAVCAIDFDTQIRPTPPRFPVPEGHSEDSYLRKLVEAGLRERYGPRTARPDAWAQADYELRVVAELGFAGFFLIAWDVVRFARAQDPPILAQGRGSAANSVLVYALKISSVDPLRYGLLFERFIHADRDGPPDIDIDIQAGRREEVLQYLYATYGRLNCAMVANEITLQPRFAVREAARVLGYAPGTVDALSTTVDNHDPFPEPADPGSRPAGEERRELPGPVLDLARALWDGGERVRHFGIHSGGVVLCSGPISDVLPVEWASMADRSIVQADKVSAADAGLYKTDCLGLRALDVVADVFEMLREPGAPPMELADIPADDPAVFDMIGDGDTIGCFQLESRAQIATSGVMRARSFRDVAVQIALIRPGPGGAGASRRYLARRAGRELVPTLHPLVDAVTAKTLGTIVYQEQVMQIALDAAGFTPVQADRLRKAMGGSKKASAEFAALRDRFYSGLAERGITGDVADSVWSSISGFSGYSFPESHALSFAFIALATAWIKKYEPARMLCSMLNRQPMGFWDSESLIADAVRHHVTVRPACVNASSADATLEELTPEIAAAWAPTHRHAPPTPQPPVRLGLSALRSVGDDAGARIAAERAANGPYTDIEDLARRTEAPLAALESLAMAGALDTFGLSRRAALWAVGAAAGSRAGHLPGTAPGTAAPPLPQLSVTEQTLGELWAGGHPEHHPMSLIRERLTAAGVIAASALPTLRHGALVRLAGLVTHRQRPPTAAGVCFLGLEDETGTMNVIVPAATWTALPRKTRECPSLLVTGTLQSADGSINIVAGRLERLPIVASPDRSRSFR